MGFSFYDKALVSSEEVEMWIGELATSMEAAKKLKIEFLVNSASEAIQDFCNRTFPVSSFSETLDGQGSDLITISQYPIQSVEELSLGGKQLTEQDFYIRKEEGAIFLKNGYRTPRGRGTVQLTYTAGYTDIPFALRQACLYQFQYFYSNYGESGSLGVTSRGKMGETERKDPSLKEFGIIAEVYGLIKRFKRLEAPSGSMFALGD